MKIYHGTHFDKLDAILENGIQPRGSKGRTNWKNAPSHPSMVYLSTAYPFYFSHSTLDYKKCTKGLVFEIEMKRLNPGYLYPDEDFIWYALKRDNPSIKLEDVRRELPSYRANWNLCLERMGTVAHLGSIGRECITRYCVVDFDKQKDIGWSVLDPTITVMNYMIKGQFYKELVSWLFGDRKVLPQVKDAREWMKASTDVEMIKTQKETVEFWKKTSKNRDGIEVVKL